MKGILFSLFSLWMVTVFCQDTKLSGSIFDLLSDRPIHLVEVVVFPKKDTLSKYRSSTNKNGYFVIEDLQKGKYILRINYSGYETVEQHFQLTSSLDLGTIKIAPESKITDEVTIEAYQIKVQQRNDTTVYNADSFKTNPDASVEELITKMPGITIINGRVYAHGEPVKKVLIDGDEFFGADATIAVRNLPAEIVHQVEIFDRQTDYAIFTDFDNGKEHKTLNIVTKKEKKNGQFGKIYAGYGNEDRYSTGGNINLFKESRKVSIIGLSNNINQQNFSNEDILGIHNDDGGGQNNIISGQKKGITTTHSGGINYADKIGENTLISGSYFYNQTINERGSQTNRQYVVANAEGQRYLKDQFRTNTNDDHRLNFRLEHHLDSSNSLIFRPKLKWQQNNSFKATNASTNLFTGQPLNTLNNENRKESTDLDVEGKLMYRHKFSKTGRTLSTKLNGSYTPSEGSKSQYSISEFFSSSLDSVNVVDQSGENETEKYSLSGDVAFTEKFGKSSMLQLNYEPSYSRANANKSIFSLNPLTGEYSEIDTLLSSIFDNEKLTQRLGLNYQLKASKLNLQLSMNYQHRVLLNDQILPIERDVRLVFNNFLPTASLRYKFSKTQNLRIFYRTKTDIPSIGQLQDVIDNSNPIRLSSGNVDLVQEFDHRVIIRYSATNPSNASSFFIYFRGDYNDDYITNSTIIADTDTLLQGNVLLREGAHYTRPVNLDGAWRVRSYATYGIPINTLKSNFNFNIGANYRVRPGMINEVRNESHKTNLNSGVSLSSNISQNIDFRFVYTYNFNSISNSVIAHTNNQYHIHNGSVYLTWLPIKNLVISSSLHTNTFQGLEEEFNQTILLYNFGVGVRFLKKEAAELRISGFDVLNNNSNINRNVTDYYIEDIETQVLNRFFMITFTYTLRNFKVKSN
jgi:hypothetical protein